MVTILFVPLAVIALASLVGWALARWISPGAALGLVGLLVLVSIGVTVFALFSDDIFAAFYFVWVTAVVAPAAMGVVVGAMLALRQSR